MGINKGTESDFKVTFWEKSKDGIQIDFVLQECQYSTSIIGATFSLSIWELEHKSKEQKWEVENREEKQKPQIDYEVEWIVVHHSKSLAVVIIIYPIEVKCTFNKSYNILNEIKHFYSQLELS